jgi:AcrR family transcriptional regulator
MFTGYAHLKNGLTFYLTNILIFYYNIRILGVCMEKDRENEILSAAKKCFLKYGYDKTTLDDIGGIVGINKVSLYYYYKNKEAIFIELINLEAEEYAANLKKKVEDIADCKTKILKWIDEGFKYDTANSIMNQLSYDSLKKFTPQLEKLKESAIKKGSDYLASLLETYRKRKEIVQCNVNDVAFAIQNVIYSIKDSTYRRSKSNLNETADINAMKKEIIFTVSLILDGIMKK